MKKIVTLEVGTGDVMIDGVHWFPTAKADFLAISHDTIKLEQDLDFARGLKSFTLYDVTFLSGRFDLTAIFCGERISRMHWVCNNGVSRVSPPLPAAAN